MIKKYNQFVEDKINESHIESDIYESVEDENGENINYEVEDGFPETIKMEEEEDEEFHGDELMKDLAIKLGIDVSEDGSINYKGNKINFYSEDNKFHIDSKKFENAEEVIKFIDRRTNKTDIESPIQSEEYKESKSYRKTRFIK